MVKIYCDSYRLKNNIDHINSAYTMMYRAVYNPGEINIPYNFKYAENLKNVLDDNERFMRELLSDKRLLNNLVRNFENTSYENAINIAKIDKEL